MTKRKKDIYDLYADQYKKENFTFLEILSFASIAIGFTAFILIFIENGWYFRDVIDRGHFKFLLLAIILFVGGIYSSIKLEIKARKQILDRRKQIARHYRRR